MKEPCFTWDPEKGKALCIIYDRNNTYYGTATCSPNDADMMSEKTGCEIAFMRATLMALRGRRDEIKTELNGLKKYYYSINRSKYFKPESYEVRRLLTHMKMLEEDIDTTKELIEQERQHLINYLDKKAYFYNKIRHNREIDKKLAKIQ